MGKINLNTMPRSGKVSAKAVKVTAPKAKKAPKKRRTESFAIYIYRVLKQVHPETGISKKSMSVLNSFITDIFERIATESSRLVRYNKRHTLSSPVTPSLKAPRPSPNTHPEYIVHYYDN